MPMNTHSNMHNSSSKTKQQRSHPRDDDKKRNSSSPKRHHNTTTQHVRYIASGTQTNDSDVDLAYFTSEEIARDDVDDDDQCYRRDNYNYSSNAVSNLSWNKNTAYLVQDMNNCQRAERGEKLKRDSESSGSSADAYSSDDEEEEEEEEEEDDEEEDGDAQIFQKQSDLEFSTLNQNLRRKQERKQRGPIRRLRRQLANSGNQEKPSNRRQRRKERKERGRAKHQEIIHGIASEIDHQWVQVEFAKNRLQNVKANLKVTQSTAKKLIMRAQQSANRVSKLSKNVLELECKLDMAMRALEQERGVIHDSMAKVAQLNETKQALEMEKNSIDANLRTLLNHVEIISSTRSEDYLSHYRFELDDKSDAVEAKGLPRQRTGTEETTVVRVNKAPSTSPTTKKKPSPLRRRSMSHNDAVRHDYELDYLSSRKQEVPFEPHATVNYEESNITMTRSPSYLRIHDLEMEDALVTLKHSNANRSDIYPIHSHDSHHVFKSLMKLAFKYATDESSRWTPDRNTEKILSKRPISDQRWHYATDSDVFVWYGKFESGYKSDLPVIKARAIVTTSARNLLDLLVDSSKVTQYNKMSLGREDKEFIKEGIETDDGKIHGEAKIVRSVSNIPMIRKKLELLSLMHARALDEEKDGMKGYLIVSRSVWEDEKQVPSEDGGEGDTVSDPNFIRSEILLGVNLIRELDECDKCEITTINHFYTPGTPTFGARQFGMKAASNFLKDLQSKFE
eukprot:CAMPEP_0176487922 /NCGR_PEP_ID=MMETSP0200_2-20121128/6413_1 /TAXON_ID=947934 /ORGANISM="Chaetoceros sp., Strain GSL56" /LENGTH=733 /DNA_ID=CAMNT_0017884829 /DNA_START=352 /DNA_END=2553 /DNA_ORIENTATION=-